MNVTSVHQRMHNTKPTPPTPVGSGASGAASNGASPAPVASLATADAVLSRVRGVVLLAGTMRVSELGEAIQRSMLDLPIRAGQSMLAGWCEQVATLGALINVERCELRVRINEGVHRPTVPKKLNRVAVDVEVDTSAYRGSGGVLRDIAQDFDDDQYLLVANAAQVLLEPLADLVKALAEPQAAVSLVSHRDGTPSGVMLIRCDVLKRLPAVGFIDLKEQALPGIAREHDVRVLHRDRPTGLPVRTLANYITALQTLYRSAKNADEAASPFVEDWQSTFALIEPGAEVGDSARIHDSIVLDGGRVGDGAVLVRGVVGPGGVVAANRTMVDCVVQAKK
ncbi:hypothetical protein ACERK3_07790 [Phycisphaerales bacterium AB-hyl4]|uniref:Uncharacterized protein n=1 Tax=Natronomicrosphaera hydrolytica TaxID=3242702 RepID=A0ABV4U620_9BACT